MTGRTVTKDELLNRVESVLTVEDISNLPVEKRRDYTRLAVEEFLRKHPEGVVLDQVVDATGLNRKTVSAHLEVLTSLRKAHRREWGPRRVVYYPMGSTGSTMDTFVEIDEHVYVLQLVESQFGRFLYIQERTRDPTGSITTKGGILIPQEGVRRLLQEIREYVED